MEAKSLYVQMLSIPRRERTVLPLVRSSMGQQLQDFITDPSPTFPILEALKFDNEFFVRKSVANHINDISKDHPEISIRLLKKWLHKAGSNSQEKNEWIMKRALRTLVREGYFEALSLLGVSSKAAVKVERLRLSAEKLRIGEKLKFCFSVKSLSDQEEKMIVDYRIHFIRSKGKR